MQRGSTVFTGLFALLTFIVMLMPHPAAADFTISYCSSQNTGAESGEATHIWQSNGWCHDKCSGYAFGVVQKNSCWCSNYIPAVQISTGECNENCPGFPSEKCGNSAEGLYGYIALGMQASGTQGAAKSTSKSPESSTESSETSTTLKTTVKSTTTSEQKSSPSTSTSPDVRIETRTVSGSVIIQTVVASPQSTSKGTPGGVIAGAVIGGLVGLAVIVGLGLFFLWRFKKDKTKSEPSIQRNTSNMSRMSRAGLISKPALDTGLAIRSHANSDGDLITPASTSHRDSGFLRPMQTNHPNASRASFNTINDNEDYSRPLKVRNPDPEA